MNKNILKKSLMLLLIGLLSFNILNTGVKSATPIVNPLFETEIDDAYSWLVAQQDSALLNEGGISGMVDSFEDFSAPDTPITEAFIYDQAVAAIAFMVYGDFTRAELVLDTLSNLQAEDGSWVNSYWYNGYWGAELRKHVGPATWVAIAVENYEVLTGDTVKYHSMAIEALDWALKYQQPNGGIAGGETTWDNPGVWTEEQWIGTEHNIGIYPTLLYFAETTPLKTATYNTAAEGVLSFLTTVVYDDVNNRFYGGMKTDTMLVDYSVPLDVNPWAVMALGVDEYAETIEYIENAAGDPVTGVGTLEYPRYVYTLSFNDTEETITGYDFDWQSDDAPGDPAWGGDVLGEDIWFEGSAFMASAYYALGNDQKATEILTEITKKMADAGSMTGGLPYSINGTNNNYWRMIQQNCISSTGWFIIAAGQWNPFTADLLNPGERTSVVEFSHESGQYPDTFNLVLSSETVGSSIYYTTNGDTPTVDSTLYVSPIEISSIAEIKAIAVSSELLNSSMKSENYVIDSQVKTPDVSVLGGTYSYDLSVSIESETNEAILYYTLDGSLPTNQDLVYSDPLTITETSTLSVIGIKDGFLDSNIVVSSYTILDPMSSPVFNIGDGSFSEAQTIEISTDIEDAVIRYTTNGEEPNSNSPIYSGPITIATTRTIKAYVSKEGLGNSLTVSNTYIINAPNVEIDEEHNTNSLTLTIMQNADWADIHYSVNVAGQQNVRMTNNSETGFPEFIVTGLSENDLVRYSFTYFSNGGAKDTDWILTVLGAVSDSQVELVTTSHDEDTYTEEFSLILTPGTVGADIYYIFDDNVNDVYVHYTEPILINGTSTIFIKSTSTGMIDSEILEITYTFELPETTDDIVIIPNEEIPVVETNSPISPLVGYIIGGLTLTGGIGFIIFKKFIF